MSTGIAMCCIFMAAVFSFRALLFISHGFGEHSLCYEDFASVFTKEGVLVFSHDHSKSRYFVFAF